MVFRKIRQDYPLSLHGVGLSLGSAEGVDKDHLMRVKTLSERFCPFLLSEHLSWSRVQGLYLPDLLPIPYTEESLRIFSQNIEETQTFLGREILIENPSSYIEYKDSTLTEPEFLKALCQKTGAKLLLDLNNVFVSSQNHGWDAIAYLKALPRSLVGEIHLAGHSLKTFEDGTVLRIDDHSSAVCDEVWDLYAHLIQEGSQSPTLIEWDEALPTFEKLMEEGEKARSYIDPRRVAYG